jgi:hypothetical protein
VFPVGYGLDLYIVFRRNSAFRGLMWLWYRICDVLHFAGRAGGRQIRPCNVHVSYVFQSLVLTLPLKGFAINQQPCLANACGLLRNGTKLVYN